MNKLLIAKVFRVPRRLRKIYYVYFNRALFFLNNIEYGRNMKVYNNFYLTTRPSAKIIIGNDFVFTSGEAFNPLCRNIRGCIFADYGAFIKIGNAVGISSACLWAKTSITIGNNVNIGGGCILLDTDAHNMDYMVRRDRTVMPNKKYSFDGYSAKSLPIIIGDDVLIGAYSIILKGVTIGARSVIGSGSIVTRDIPADCIAAGNPARVIKYL